jgi:putative PIN family toxin of toxin-antitoxin system
VLVSALATRGLCADVLTLVLAEHDLILGEQVLSELRRVLEKKMRVPRRRVEEVEAFLRAQAHVAEGGARPLIKVRDSADAKVLAEAISGEAEILVTGDRDLLEVAAKAPLRIVTPRGFWEQVRGNPPKS